MTRYVGFRCRWFGIYVHKFHMSDYPVVHDHPWNFLTLPLTNGYWEHLPDGTVADRRPFRFKFRTAEEFHWIELKEGAPLWTLFIHFRKRRDWGFWSQTYGWVPHNEYNRRLGLE